MTAGEGTTSRAKGELAVLVPSLTVRVRGATPVWPAAGVRVTVRLLPLPPKTMLALGRRAVFEELPETVRLPAAVSRSATVKGIGPVGILTNVLVAAIAEMSGEVFAGRTVTTKAVLLDLPPVSITRTVMTEEPICAPAVTLTLRPAPAPPKVIPAKGMTVRSAEALSRTRLEAGSSASRTVKDSGPVD